MAIDYKAWDAKYNVTENDVKDIQSNENKDYVEVPYGQYEVSIASMELASSKKGDPMLKVRFRILEGKYKGQSIFMNQVITEAYTIHKSDEFLRSLDTGIDVEWLGSYARYADMIDSILEESKKLEYGLDYSSNDKGYASFKIFEVYEKE